MFGFMRKKDDLFVLHQKLGRLLNDFCFTEVGDQSKRSESRTRVALPCLLFLFREADEPSCYATAVTSDLSLHGSLLIANECLEPTEYIVVLAAKDQRLYVRATCKRCAPGSLGTYTVGIEFTKILHPSDYPAIVKAVSTLESPPAQPVMPALATGNVASSYVAS